MHAELMYSAEALNTKQDSDTTLGFSNMHKAAVVRYPISSLCSGDTYCQ